MPTPQEMSEFLGVDLREQSGDPQFRICERRLPHWEFDGSIYFITFNTWERLELSMEARRAVLDACLFFDGKRHQVFAVVVMPDHVHLLIQPWLNFEGEYWSISSIMNSIKGYSAKQIPKVMKHVGTVWQDERFDRIIRSSKDFYDTWNYIRQNPVEAGLAPNSEDYPFFWQVSSPDLFRCNDLL